MNTFEKLETLTAKAKADAALRGRLLGTRESRDPLASFCAIAQAAGVDLSVG